MTTLDAVHKTPADFMYEVGPWFAPGVRSLAALSTPPGRYPISGRYDCLEAPMKPITEDEKQLLARADRQELGHAAGRRRKS